MDFPQLYTVSSYSLLASTIRIPTFVSHAKQLGYQALGISDINVMYGAIEFYEACKKEGLKPIIGLTLEYTNEEGRLNQLLLFAKDLVGYQNLMRISSERMNNQQAFSVSEISSFFKHLYGILPADKGDIYASYQKNPSEAHQQLQELQQLFDKDSFYIGLSFTSNPQKEPDLFSFYKEANQSFIGLQETRYLQREENFSLQVLKHIESGEQMTMDTREIEGPLYLRTAEEAVQQLTSLGGEECVKNAKKLAETCNVEIPLHQKLLPHYPVPNQQPSAAFLKQLCEERLPVRVPDYNEVYTQRLEKELSIIHNMGFDDYFLIVWDVMDFAHKNQIVTGAGRGSAAGSLVSYVLSITDVDPIKYDLLFERFLNPERYSMPDIDLDIPDNQRERVLEYVSKKYGQYHVAQIATFGTMAAKMVLRDIARVFGLSQSESNRWSNAIPNALKMTLERAYKESKKLVELVQSSELNQQLFEAALKLEGLPRHVSTHAAGVVISDENLLNLVPLQPGSNDIFLTQFTMNDVEKIGLLKMDFLGLRNLSIIDDTLKGIKRINKQEIQLSQIPLNDEKTLALFRKGDTDGIFQFESAGIRNVLRKLSPSDIEDIAAVNALYRPGPMKNIDAFIRRKKGQEPIVYPDNSLESILKNTYGIMVYQEQIMQVASKMAGFTLGQADILRRAISKKKKDVLDEERAHFVKGAQKQGYPLETATTVYDYIERFADYGFNRSHAFAYSFIGFQMAYLKVHFPGAFYAAILNSVRHHSSKLKTYINEAKKNQINILQPSINKSQYYFYLKSEKEILFGFSSLKGIRRDFIQHILDERSAQGPFKSLDNFLFRIDRKWVKEETIEPLIRIGAFDEVESNRKKLLADLPKIVANIQLSSGSIALLDDLELTETAILDFTLEEKLAMEEEYLGVYLSGHPTEEFKKIRLAKQIIYVSDCVEQQTAHLLLYIKDVRMIRTKKGEQMAFAEGDDVSGELSLTIFPKMFRQMRQTIETNQVYYVEGKIERSTYNQELQLLVNQMEKAAPIEASIHEQTCYLRITEQKDTKETMEQVQQIIQRHKGHVPVILYFQETGKKIVLNDENWIDDSKEAKAQLAYLLGEENIAFK